MKLRSIEIRGYQQFQHTVLDFTDPATGKAADKVCFIGRNGTGKSTILRLLQQVLRVFEGGGDPLSTPCVLELEWRDRCYLAVAGPVRVYGTSPILLFDPSNDQVAGVRDAFFDDVDAFMELRENWQRALFRIGGDGAWDHLQLDNVNSDLLLYSPAETSRNEALRLSDVPSASVSSALELGDNFPVYHEVSHDSISDMWRVLLYLIVKRKELQDAFENRPDNLDKSKRQLIAEFDRAHPKVLPELAGLWNRILAPAGLSFDVDGAHIPIQLGDNLKAYIRHASTGEHIRYNELSTGIRDFLFHIGHLFVLYFNRRIERGFVLIDEPENSLFPDFLFELMDVYDTIVRNSDGTTGTQFFVATHNPIVAAQFEPHERIILEWDGHGRVTAKKGVAPAGDDPNDVLEQDFELTHLMGRKGQEMWERYLDRRKQARRSDDPDEQKALLEEANDIARRYRFGHEAP